MNFNKNKAKEQHTNQMAQWNYFKSITISIISQQLKILNQILQEDQHLKTTSNVINKERVR